MGIFCIILAITAGLASQTNLIVSYILLGFGFMLDSYVVTSAYKELKEH